MNYMIDDNYSSKIRQQKKINFQKKNNKNITTKIKGKETNLSNIYNTYAFIAFKNKKYNENKNSNKNKNIKNDNNNNIIYQNNANKLNSYKYKKNINSNLFLNDFINKKYNLKQNNDGNGTISININNSMKLSEPQKNKNFSNINNLLFTQKFINNSNTKSKRENTIELKGNNINNINLININNLQNIQNINISSNKKTKMQKNKITSSMDNIASVLSLNPIGDINKYNEISKNIKKNKVKFKTDKINVNNNLSSSIDLSKYLLKPLSGVSYYEETSNFDVNEKDKAKEIKDINNSGGILYNKENRRLMIEYLKIFKNKNITLENICKMHYINTNILQIPKNENKENIEEKMKNNITQKDIIFSEIKIFNNTDKNEKIDYIVFLSQPRIMFLINELNEKNPYIFYLTPDISLYEKAKINYLFKWININDISEEIFYDISLLIKCEINRYKKNIFEIVFKDNDININKKFVIDALSPNLADIYFNGFQIFINNNNI